YYLIFRQPLEPLARIKSHPLGYTSLVKERAVELSAFIIDVFSSVCRLKAYGINKETWSGLSSKSCDLDYKTFELFQIELFARWKDEFVASHQIQYWATVLPEIHSYSYGANQTIS